MYSFGIEAKMNRPPGNRTPSVLNKSLICDLSISYILLLFITPDLGDICSEVCGLYDVLGVRSSTRLSTHLICSNSSSPEMERRNLSVMIG
jgi:hypothetical protein